MRTLALSALLLLSVVASVDHARADAIDGPPACPPGARGDAAHEGQWCIAWPCTGDAECDGGQCRPWRVCTQTSMVVPGGLRPQEPPPERRELVIATCDPARACTGTEEPPPPVVGTLETDAPTCVDAIFCVPPSLPAFPGRPPSAGSAPVATSSAPGSEEPTASGLPPRSPSARSGSCGCRAAGHPASAGSTLALSALALAALALRRIR
jgi:MYXO-CTERM domain-containing protein